jgi:hypothetical protein
MSGEAANDPKVALGAMVQKAFDHAVSLEPGIEQQLAGLSAAERERWWAGLFGSLAGTAIASIGCEALASIIQGCAQETAFVHQLALSQARRR